jgi:hypothetical protein
MYCQNCGSEVTGKFCSGCGTAVDRSANKSEQEKQNEQIVSINVMDRINEEIKKNGKSPNLQDFWGKYKPNKYTKRTAWIFGIGVVLSLCLLNPIPLIFAVVAYVIFSYFGAMAENTKRNMVKYSYPPSIQINQQDLFYYLKENLAFPQLNFTEHGTIRGNDDLIWIDYEFNKKSLHSIRIDTTNHVYQITAQRPIMGRWLAFGGSHNMLYRNSVYSTPVVKAVMDCYFENQEAME